MNTISKAIDIALMNGTIDLVIVFRALGPSRATNGIRIEPPKIVFRIGNMITRVKSRAAKHIHM
jgi:hypothetical protein